MGKILPRLKREIREHKHLTAANSHLLTEVVWPYFWLAQPLAAG